MSFLLVRFVRFVRLLGYCVNPLSIRDLQKLAELVLKIGPIGCKKFDSARKLSYLCIV